MSLKMIYLLSALLFLTATASAFKVLDRTQSWEGDPKPWHVKNLLFKSWSKDVAEYPVKGETILIANNTLYIPFYHLILNNGNGDTITFEHVITGRKYERFVTKVEFVSGRHAQINFDGPIEFDVDVNNEEFYRSYMPPMTADWMQDPMPWHLTNLTINACDADKECPLGVQAILKANDTLEIVNGSVAVGDNITFQSAVTGRQYETTVKNVLVGRKGNSTVAGYQFVMVEPGIPFDKHVHSEKEHYENDEYNPLSKHSFDDKNPNDLKNLVIDRQDSNNLWIRQIEKERARIVQESPKRLITYNFFDKRKGIQLIKGDRITFQSVDGDEMYEALVASVQFRGRAVRYEDGTYHTILLITTVDVPVKIGVNVAAPAAQDPSDQTSTDVLVGVNNFYYKGELLGLDKILVTDQWFSYSTGDKMEIIFGQYVRNVFVSSVSMVVKHGKPVYLITLRNALASLPTDVDTTQEPSEPQSTNVTLPSLPTDADSTTQEPSDLQSTNVTLPIPTKPASGDKKIRNWETIVVLIKENATIYVRGKKVWRDKILVTDQSFSYSNGDKLRIILRRRSNPHVDEFLRDVYVSSVSRRVNETDGTSVYLLTLRKSFGRTEKDQRPNANDDEGNYTIIHTYESPSAHEPSDPKSTNVTLPSLPTDVDTAPSTQEPSDLQSTNVTLPSSLADGDTAPAAQEPSDLQSTNVTLSEPEPEPEPPIPKFIDTPESTPEQTPATSTLSKTIIWVLVTIALVVLVVFFGSLLFVCLYRRRKVFNVSERSKMLQSV